MWMPHCIYVGYSVERQSFEMVAPHKSSIVYDVHCAATKVNGFRC